MFNSGLLSGKQIHDYGLIEGASEENFKAFSYDLCLGEDILVCGLGTPEIK